MHHTINLGYGDSITIHTPEHAPIKVQAICEDALIEETKNYPIFETVSKATGISIAQILSKRRPNNLVFARCYIANVLLSQNNMTLAAIATLLNRKDHSTIIHYKELYRDLIKTNEASMRLMIKKIQVYEKNQSKAKV